MMPSIYSVLSQYLFEENAPSWNFQLLSRLNQSCRWNMAIVRRGQQDCTWADLIAIFYMAALRSTPSTRCIAQCTGTTLNCHSNRHLAKCTEHVRHCSPYCSHCTNNSIGFFAAAERCVQPPSTVQLMLSTLHKLMECSRIVLCKLWSSTGLFAATFNTRHRLRRGKLEI